MLICHSLFYRKGKLCIIFIMITVIIYFFKGFDYDYTSNRKSDLYGLKRNRLFSSSFIVFLSFRFSIFSFSYLFYEINTIPKRRMIAVIVDMKTNKHYNYDRLSVCISHETAVYLRHYMCVSCFYTASSNEIIKKFLEILYVYKFFFFLNFD